MSLNTIHSQMFIKMCGCLPCVIFLNCKKGKQNLDYEMEKVNLLDFEW